MENELSTLIDKTADSLSAKFKDEVKRLLNSGAVDPSTISRGLLFGVALENLADTYLRGSRWNSEYRNLIRF